MSDAIINGFVMSSVFSPYVILIPLLNLYCIRMSGVYAIYILYWYSTYVFMFLSVYAGIYDMI